MRFSLDLYFLDASQALVAVHQNVPRHSIVVCRGAAGVLERPARLSLASVPP
jgi:uncharacterized membrane protein (UPF0127 family)